MHGRHAGHTMQLALCLRNYEVERMAAPALCWCCKHARTGGVQARNVRPAGAHDRAPRACKHTEMRECIVMLHIVIDLTTLKNDDEPYTHLTRLDPRISCQFATY